MRATAARCATEDQVAAANPPAGFEPIVSNSPFGWANGPIFEAVQNGAAVRGFRVAEPHINMGGFCHGGMIMTFADIVLARAIYAVAEPPMLTVRMTTDFIAPVPLGAWVEGRAEITGIRGTLVSGQGQLSVDGRPVAALAGSFMIRALRS